MRILKDDRVATLKDFLIKIPKDKAKKVRINMKEDLRRVVEALFPEAKIVAAPLHIIANFNKRMDEAKRIEQEVNYRKKVKIPKKIFPIREERLGEEEKRKVEGFFGQVSQS